MNSREITKTVYKIQDMAITGILLFETFSNVFHDLWKKHHKKNEAPTYQIQKIFEFVNRLKNCPALLFALTPMFKMVLKHMLTKSCTLVYHEKFDKYYFIIPRMIKPAFNVKNVLRKKNMLVIPYKKRKNPKLRITMEMYRFAFTEVHRKYGCCTNEGDVFRYMLKFFL